MDRKEFFKNTCKFGLCACAGLSLMNMPIKTKADDSGENEEDWRIGFMQKRFAKLIDILNSNLDETGKNEILEELGRECAKEGIDHIIKFKGDIEGFLKNIEEQWVEKVEFNKESNEIKIFDKKRDSCYCPFVDKAITSKDFCNCSIGWQKAIYETILGKEVDVEILSSVLRGGEGCSFVIKIKS
ncbi:MAG: hypothetical protein JXB17_09530 [Bacteroidales bacterium]|nr:hypothetical protein [Bacteroidales bacterium]